MSCAAHPERVFLIARGSFFKCATASLAVAFLICTGVSGDPGEGLDGPGGFCLVWVGIRMGGRAFHTVVRVARARAQVVLLGGCCHMVLARAHMALVGLLSGSAKVTSTLRKRLWPQSGILAKDCIAKAALCIMVNIS